MRNARRIGYYMATSVFWDSMGFQVRFVGFLQIIYANVLVILESEKVFLCILCHAFTLGCNVLGSKPRVGRS